MNYFSVGIVCLHLVSSISVLLGLVQIVHTCLLCNGSTLKKQAWIFKGPALQSNLNNQYQINTIANNIITRANQKGQTMRADWPTKSRSLGFKEFVSKSFDRVATSRISDSFLSLGFSFQFLVKKIKKQLGRQNQ